MKKLTGTTILTNKQPASERVVAAASSAGGSSFPSPFPGNFKSSCSKGWGDLHPHYQSLVLVLLETQSKNLNCPFCICFSSRAHPPLAFSPFPQLTAKPPSFQRDGCKLSQGHGGKPQQPACQPPPQTPAPQEHLAPRLCGNGTHTSFWPASSSTPILRDTGSKI